MSLPVANQLLDSWDIHNQMLFLLFDAIEPEGFKGKPTGMSGRSVGNIFAHMNNIRLGWIETSAPALRDGLIKIPTRLKVEREAITKNQLRPALEASAKGIRDLLQIGVEGGKLKNPKPHFMGKYSYFIAHEWYHIGEICMTLTLSGHRLDDKILYSIWAWGRWNVSSEEPEQEDEE